MPAWLPPLITAGASLIGNVLNRRSEVDAAKASSAKSRKDWFHELEFNRQQARIARDWSADQADIDRNLTRQFRAEDMAAQENFAKNSTGWAFDDLMRAADESGIHRLAAIGGATGSSYSPVGGSGSYAGGGAAASATGGYVPEAAIGGSIIGDGMNAVADFFHAQNVAKKEEAANAEQKARADALLASELDRNSAEAEMYRARARSDIASASQVNGPPPVNFATPNQREEYFHTGVTMPDGSRRNIPTDSPGMDELGGAGMIWTWDKILDGIQGTRAARKKWSEGSTSTFDNPNAAP